MRFWAAGGDGIFWSRAAFIIVRLHSVSRNQNPRTRDVRRVAIFFGRNVTCKSVSTVYFSLFSYHQR